MAESLRKRLSGLSPFLRKQNRRLVLIIVAGVIGQLAGIPIPSGAYPATYIYPIAFLPLLFIAGGGGLVGLVGYAIGGTIGDLARFGPSLAVLLFDLSAFAFAGWFTGIALKTRTGLGQSILALIATFISGVFVVFVSPIGANLAGQDFGQLYANYLYGWLPFFIIPTVIVSFWMSRIRELFSKFAGEPIAEEEGEDKKKKV